MTNGSLPKPSSTFLTRRSRNQTENSLRRRNGRRTVNRAARRSDRWGSILLGPDHDPGDRAGCLGGAPSGMTGYFYQHQIRIFDYPQWAGPLREALRKTMEGIAAENSIEIEFVRSRKSFRKEDRVRAVPEKGGEHPGRSLHPFGNGAVRQLQALVRQKTHKTYLKPDDGKCLHHSVYFIDEDLGLCWFAATRDWRAHPKPPKGAR